VSVRRENQRDTLDMKRETFGQMRGRVERPAHTKGGGRPEFEIEEHDTFSYQLVKLK
jgi:hypothetical protein